MQRQMVDRRKLSDVFWAGFGWFLARWIALNVAAWAVLLGVLLVLLALPAVLPMADVYSLSGMEAEDWLTFALIVLYVMGLGTLFSVLGAPFLPFQKWIVGPIFPHLRPGYIAICAYGPVLIAVWLGPKDLFTPTGGVTVLFYEGVALATTLLYARIAAAAELFADRPALQAR